MLPKPLRVLIVASEMHPFAKAGGLADVVDALSAALHARGHDVRVVLPLYSSVSREAFARETRVGPLGVWMGDQEHWCTARQGATASGVPVYAIEHDGHFKRWGYYHDEAMHDYEDNPRRFGFFCRAALELCREIGFRPDVVHANDWQTALTPAYLKIWHWDDSLLAASASVLTLHNVAYQGIYPKHHYGYLGLGEQNFTPTAFETYGQVNLLKGGVAYADVVTAVSPTFARELTTPHGGFGLAPYLADRGPDLVGILNGIDDRQWDPATDPALPAHFSARDLEGKRECKRRLQSELALTEDSHVALIGAVGRFVDQKGFHLVAQTIERILESMHVQFAILGSGESNLQDYFGALPRRYPGRVGSYIGFDDGLAHRIEAGADFFLMPSLFEPCGLNQMYSQRYGTLPIVRATGGLDDTVANYDEATGRGTGYKFDEPSASALYYAVGWAISTYYDRPQHHRAMIAQAMTRDYSWHSSSLEYEEAYSRALQNKRRYDARCTASAAGALGGER